MSEPINFAVSTGEEARALKAQVAEFSCLQGPDRAWGMLLRYKQGSRVQSPVMLWKMMPARLVAKLILGGRTILGTKLEDVWILHGLKRSGNHALANWINSDRDFWFVNNIVPIDPILRQSAKNLPKFDLGFIKRGRNLRRPLVHLRQVISRRPLLLSLEDSPALYVPIEDQATLKVSHIVLIRKFENVFSSRLRKQHDSKLIAYSSEPAILRGRVELWKSHAKTILETLEPSNPGFSNVTPVIFEAFLQSYAYRKNLIEKLGLSISPTLPPLEKITGGGSSWNNEDWNREALLNRASNLDHEDQVLLKAIYDTEARALDARIEALISSWL